MPSLDAEEQALLESVELGEWQPVPDIDQETERYQKYARSQLNTKALGGSNPNQLALPSSVGLRPELEQVLQALRTKLNIPESLSREGFPADPLIQALEEITVLKAADQNELRSVPDLIEEIQRYQRYAQVQVGTETVNFELSHSDLQALKAFAQQSGTSVSVLMATVLHQFVISRQE
ncbi:MAG: hypothetical protein AAF728_05065 [Cyanobacteria bacterium P01_D01_bin.128]